MQGVPLSLITVANVATDIGEVIDFIGVAEREGFESRDLADLARAVG